jgi:ATP:cob(I)alamin adenosyltransferase
MLYTKKGDDGKTQIFDCDQRFSKSSAVAEALGALDEVNSFLGVVKCKVNNQDKGIMHQIQENLFIIQAEVGGAEKKISKDKISEIEKIIDKIEKELPPIKTFFISGATELSAKLDFARTLARRAERRVIKVKEEGLVKISQNTLAYLNRLSSLLYALARQSAYKSGIKESAPTYK